MKEKQIILENILIYTKRVFVVIGVYLFHSIAYGFLSTHHIGDGFSLFTDFDKLLPFTPEMVYVYMSFYVVILLSVFAVKTENDFNRMITSILATLIFTYPFFYFFPAYYPPVHFETNNFTTKFLQWCFEADVPNNTFPSLHVGLSFTIAFGIMHLRKRIGWLYLIWAIAIAFSTVMVRKHFVMDVFGGIIIATLSYKIFIAENLARPLFRFVDNTKIQLVATLENKMLAKNISSKFISMILFFLKLNR
jgi:membrane-associated phospholipid phosphatase